jgi:putative ABC transport system permease protein
VRAFARYYASVLSDIRQACRSLRRSPAFAVTSILTLAIGIGGSTAILSVVNAVIWRPLPFRQPEQLVRLWESHPADGRTRIGVAAANAADWKSRSSLIDDVALFDVFSEPVVIGAEQARQAVVTPNFLAILGVQPVFGRMFTAVTTRDEFQAVGPRATAITTEVIVSDEFRRRAFAPDEDVIGRAVTLEGRAGGVIIGVLPPGMPFPANVDVWTALNPRRTDRAARDYGAIARVKTGTDVAAARSELQSIAVQLSQEFARTNDGWTIEIVPLHDSIVGSHRLGLLTLLAAVVFVMLIGCANLSNLLLARGMTRESELAVRTALGASRARIARLLLAEAMLVALLGGVAGWCFAAGALPLLLRLADAGIPRLTDARLDLVVLASCAAFAGVSAVLAGLTPAARLSRPDLQTAMRPSSERITGPGAHARLQRMVVAAELAACLILLVGALLFTRTFIKLRTLDLGFDPSHVISIDARMPLYRTMDPSRWQRLASDTTAVLDRLKTVAGVTSVAAASDPPLSGELLTTELRFPGETRVGQALYHRVSPGYFRTLGMTMVAGRDFTNGDASDLALLPDPRAGQPRPGAVIINETTARTFWPAGHALGQSLSTSYDMRVVNRREVVGIVRDAISEGRRDAPPVEVYIPYLEDPSFATTLLVRTEQPPDQIVPVLRREAQSAAPDLSIANIRPLDDVVAKSLASPRFGAALVSAFAVAALLLAAVGVYGVCAFGVSTRVREIAIRMALGATRQKIVAMFLRQAAGAIGLGLVMGAAGAFACGRLVGNLLFGVPATDVASFAIAALLLAAVACAAVYLPVRRVLRTIAYR